MIIYQQEKDVDPDEFIMVLVKSTLGERRPIQNRQSIESMLRHANLIITARDNGHLVGIARSLTDFSFCIYLSDLAVDLAYQKAGIGKELIKQTKSHVSGAAKLILLSAPQAEKYYPKIGMKRHEHCYTVMDVDEII